MTAKRQRLSQLELSLLIDLNLGLRIPSSILQRLYVERLVEKGFARWDQTVPRITPAGRSRLKAALNGGSR